MLKSCLEIISDNISKDIVTNPLPTYNSANPNEEYTVEVRITARDEARDMDITRTELVPVKVRFIAPPEKVLVGDRAKLTGDEKTAGAEKVKNANPTLTNEDKIEVAENGDVTIKYKSGKTATIPASYTVVQKPEIVPVVDKTNLTEDEKKEVEDKVRKANDFPNDTKVTVGKDGVVKVEYPDGTTTTIPGTDTVFEVPKTKVPVRDDEKLTDDEKAEVEDNIKELDPNIDKIIVRDDGTSVVIFKNGTKVTIPGSYLVIQIPEKNKDVTVNPNPQPLPTVIKVEPIDKGNVALNMDDHAQYMMGYKDGSFKPNNNMTREEVAVMFSKLMANRPVKGMIYSNNLKDIAPVRWSATAVTYLNGLHIIQGYTDGTFGPEKFTTRAEFAAIALRFANLSEGNKTFIDVNLSHWAYASISKAASAGWISGYPDGTFKPDQPITRAEVVSIVNRMLNRYADTQFVENNKAQIVSFNDINNAHRAYYPIVEATNGHDFTRAANGVDELWSSLKVAHSYMINKSRCDK